MNLWSGWLSIVLTFVSPFVMADDFLGFSTSGYIRYGFGYTRGVDKHACYGAQGAHGVSRLGNECNQYVDFQLKHDLGNREGGIYLHSELGWDFLAEEGGGFDLINRDERFLKLGGLGDGDTEIWLGTRTYRRKEAHLLDFKYSNLWGKGFGAEGVSVLGGRFAYAFLSRPAEEEGTFDSHITHDARLYDLPVDLNLPESAKVEVGVKYARMKLRPGFSPGQNTVEGFSISSLLQQRVSQGVSNKTSVQIGVGALADLDTRLNLKSDASGGLLPPSSYRIYRLVNETLVEDLKRTSVMLTQIVEKQSVKGVSDSGFLWGSFGGRVKFYKSDYLNYVIDGSIDYVDDNIKNTTSLVKKLTVAVQLSRGRGFYSRPALRIYTTYAKSAGSRDRPQSGVLSDTGFSCGMQFETWW